MTITNIVTGQPHRVLSRRFDLVVLTQNPMRAVPIITLLFVALNTSAVTAPPASLTPQAADGTNRVCLAWPAVGGAASYNMKRSLTPGGPHALLANVTTTNYTDATVLPGTNYFYAVTTVSNSIESAAFREVQAATVVIGDNSDASGVALAGVWVVSGVPGYYGANSVYATTVTGATATATCTFTPTLPTTANYDIYLRWTAFANRPTDAPVDIVFADNRTTVTVDQTTNGSTWVWLGTFPCEAGNSNSVTIRNNTSAANKAVVADAVQFVPRLSPWGNATNWLQDYTVTTFADNISGTNLDTTKWAIAFGRPNVSVGNGKISLDLEYIGTNPIAQATAAELKDPNNWNKGAVQPLHDQKFGYYEARFRVNQDGGGVDNAFWFPASLESPWEGYEYDVPEIITQPVPNFGNTDAGYGIRNHVNGAHLWDTNASPPSYANVGNAWGLTNYHTFGFEWRTDNSLVIYFDGEPLSRALPSKVNALATILPAVPVLSTWVGQFMQPTANLDGQSMKIDYLRCYQKPGWLGAVSSAWTNPANWGADGIPGAGAAAVFNLNAAQSTVTLPTNQPVQSLAFDHANLSATTINGPGALLLGAGTNSVLTGGIAMGSATMTTQTVNAAIIAQKDLSFYNSSGTNAPLVLNGTISGDGVTPRDIHFICGAPILVAQPLPATIGEVVVWGGTPLALPTNCAYVGRTVIDTTTFLAGRIGNGGQPSSVGASSAHATNLVLFSNRIHSEPYRPRLRYVGSGEISDRGILISPAAQGILEASGSGPLTLTGPVVFDPEKVAGDITNTAPSLILGGTNTNNNTLASDFISTNGLNLTLTKSGAGTWVLTGDIVLSNTLSVTGGRLQIGAGTNGSLSANSVGVSASAEFALGRDDDLTFTIPITGSGGFRKLGAGQLTFAGTNTYSGPTIIANGTLILTGSIGAGAVTVATNATLGGSGLLRGPVTVNGTLAPGGTLTISNNLVLAGTAVLAFDLGTSSDRVAVSSNLTLAGTLTIADAGGFGAGTYTLFTYGGALINNGVTIGTVPDVTCNYTLDTATANQVRLIVSAPVPFKQWQLQNFGSTTTSNSLPLATPAGDGLPNLLKYATGLNPTTAVASALRNFGRSNGWFTITFNRNTAASDINYYVEATSSLLPTNGWSCILSNLNATGWLGPASYTESAPTNGLTQVRVLDILPNATNRFLRLRVTQP